MKKIIIITGTPGTGKSTVAKALAKKYSWDRLDLHHYYPLFSIGYNHQKKCYDINLRKFEAWLHTEVPQHKKQVVLDSHIAHLLPRKMVNGCIVMTCSNLKKLQARLQRRKYSAAKIKENLEAEIFQVCLTEARERKHKILVVDGCQHNFLNKLIKQLDPYFQKRR